MLVVMLSLAASALPRLVALANQTRVEDCDLAIHAEVENARSALLSLCSLGASGSGIEQLVEANAGEGALGSRRPKLRGPASEDGAFGADVGETEGAGGEASAAAAQTAKHPPRRVSKAVRPKPDKNTEKERKERTTYALPAKFKQAALSENAPVSGCCKPNSSATLTSSVARGRSPVKLQSFFATRTSTFPTAKRRVFFLEAGKPASM